jgi:hypothetical protein
MEEFKGCEITRLDRILCLRNDERLRVKMKSFAEKRKEMIEKQDVITFLTYEFSNVIEQIYELGLKDDKGIQWKLYMLESSIFPSIAPILCDMFQTDANETMSIIKYYKNQLTERTTVHHVIHHLAGDFLESQLLLASPQ